MTPQYLKYQGALYRLGAPPLRLVPQRPEAPGDPVVDQARMEAQRGLDESRAEQQQLHAKWHEELAQEQALAVELARQQEAVRLAKRDYHSVQADIDYYREVLDRLGRLEPQDRAWLREHSWLR